VVHTAGGNPGIGGVSRGRADAEMTWGRESAGDTERFEAKSLPSAQYPDSEHSAVLGIGAASPEVDPTAEGAGLANVTTSTGKAAWERRLAPHHRDAVKTFFTRDTTTPQKK
jgi:hypothetical protein